MQGIGCVIYSAMLYLICKSVRKVELTDMVKNALLKLVNGCIILIVECIVCILGLVSGLLGVFAGYISALIVVIGFSSALIGAGSMVEICMLFILAAMILMLPVMLQYCISSMIQVGASMTGYIRSLQS